MGIVDGDLVVREEGVGLFRSLEFPALRFLDELFHHLLVAAEPLHEEGLSTLLITSSFFFAK